MLAKVAVIISANIEWKAVSSLFPQAEMMVYPFGEMFDPPPGRFFETERSSELRFFHGGWGKISAAASAQYVIDHWAPDVLINLGTCGGFAGEVALGAILLVERTVVYDIVEQMGDFDEHIAHYTTDIDLSWLRGDAPYPVLRTLLVSGDRDLIPRELPILKQRYRAIAGDWESGAIAFVAARNRVRCLILRGVTDLVTSESGEAYDGTMQVFTERTGEMMRRLMEGLPGWLKVINYST